MALSFTRVGSLPYRVVGSERETVTDVALDNSYPVAGETITAANLGLNAVNSGNAQLKTSATTTVNMANAHFEASATGGTLTLFDETPAAVGDASDMNGMVVRVTARGY